jgi:hypothetical protein
MWTASDGEGTVGLTNGLILGKFYFSYVSKLHWECYDNRKMWVSQNQYREVKIQVIKKYNIDLTNQYKMLPHN